MKITITPTLASKLASVVVHAHGWFSPTGHNVDKVAIAQLIVDPEVTAWLDSLGPLAPVKR